MPTLTATSWTDTKTTNIYIGTENHYGSTFSFNYDLEASNLEILDAYLTVTNPPVQCQSYAYITIGGINYGLLSDDATKGICQKNGTTIIHYDGAGGYKSKDDFPQPSGTVSVRFRHTGTTTYTIPSITLTIEFGASVKLVWPATSGTTTYTQHPRFRLKNPTSAAITYKYKIKDNTNNTTITSSNISVGSVNANAEAQFRYTSTNLTRNHEYSLQIFNNNGTTSIASKIFYVAAAAPTTVSQNSKVKASDMQNLAQYINNLSSYYGSTATAPTVPTAGSKIQLADFSTFITAANALPSTTQVSAPSNPISASYYNTYINNIIKDW